MTNRLMLILGTVPPLVLLFVYMLSYLRRVVAVNEVHVVQRRGRTLSYGKEMPGGNVYYAWPSWFPVLGVNALVLPVSIFDLDLPDYEAYDMGRLPLVVHIKAFFRIKDSNTAAQRIPDFKELSDQLEAVVQGSVRSVLAGHDIHDIMHQRSQLEEAMTKEVAEQLPYWGVESVKSIELMDIRDAEGSLVIHNIMMKRRSEIEMESRVEIAKNGKIAQQSEIEAEREIELQKQQATQAVGIRQAQAAREIQLATQEAAQVVKVAERQTKEKELDIARTQAFREAEIDKEQALIRADKSKQVTVLAAQAQLESERLHAAGVQALGMAKAESEKALLLAPVEAQTRLAKEIGANVGYQSYLTTIKKVEATMAIGIEQAKALDKADIKIIVNSGAPAEGVSKVMDLFSSKGGTEIGAMFEALKNTPVGKDLLAKFVGSAEAE